MKRRTLLAAAAVPFVTVLGWARAARAANSYYEGPVSDHFDGRRFFLPGARYKTSSEVMRWSMTRKPSVWPQAFPSPFEDKPPARVGDGGLRVTLIGHASFLIQCGGLNFLADPVFSERASPVGFAGPRRVNPPGIKPEHLPEIDAILLTHNHYDHMDLPSLKQIVDRHRARIITPLGNDTILRAGGIEATMSVLDWGESVALANGVSVHAVPAAHWSARGLFDRRFALWCAFVLTTPAGVVYHIGDTAYHQPLFRQVRERFGAPRLALLPIGAYEPRWFMRDQHMDPEEAVRAFVDCGARAAIGHHWGTFQLTDEAADAPAQSLAAALERQGLAADRFRPFWPGQVWQS